MSVHKTECIICGEVVWCTQDEHALGIGGKRGEGGCDNPPYIEFCSLGHALELQRRIALGIQNFRGLYPEKADVEQVTR